MVIKIIFQLPASIYSTVLYIEKQTKLQYFASKQKSCKLVLLFAWFTVIGRNNCFRSVFFKLWERPGSQVGDDVYFECHVESNPELKNITWRHNVSYNTCHMKSNPELKNITWRHNVSYNTFHMDSNPELKNITWRHNVSSTTCHMESNPEWKNILYHNVSSNTCHLWSSRDFWPLLFLSPRLTNEEPDSKQWRYEII